MKHILWLLLLACSFLLKANAPLVPGLRTGMEIDDVVNALRNGNARQLSRFFDSRVDITLSDRSDNYSRTQAEMILRDFFSTNDVKSFELRYKGENNGSRYCLGTLKTRNGDYRTRLFMKQKDNHQVLQEISFQTLQ